MNDYTLRTALEHVASFADDSDGGLRNIAQSAAKALADHAADNARDEENAAKLQEIGKSAFAALAEMVAALECDYERLEELREALKAEGLINAEAREELHAIESAAGDCKDREDAEQRIHEDPLSIEVRGDWCDPAGAMDRMEPPTEFRILLGTGGPAVRIIGELDASGQPKSATLQTQDWFLPWTDYRDADEETLLTYCRCFYFGEG
jgi:hypothetical protein